MSDSEIIWKYLNRNILNESLLVYFYIKSSSKDKSSIAIEKTLESTQLVFGDSIEKNLIIIVIKAFFKDKENQYKRGEISIKSAY